jgi:hypothetical protein
VERVFSGPVYPQGSLSERKGLCLEGSRWLILDLLANFNNASQCYMAKSVYHDMR